MGPCCSVCVHLSPDHTHDLLLDFGVLSIDIGVSHLAVFVPGGVEGVRMACRGRARAYERWQDSHKEEAGADVV